ncbi:tRNA pseudouridine(55) synthase TruB [Berryella wangjianweii]|uniref:tRNA pseudouridine synthase B n=1 Tax=Berryella wangjianweii TaxID=2734634 RepID=A0A6M8IZ94_9ACTN|nr:tRNA pseudouridine(55) synthase TruB [Berryella wangjianweii]QKF07030.1 tRNA pseudouridine(55) synthase TruB [Berryella wangjianweii]
MRRGESGFSLLLAVDKPQGMSSHDVVNRVRRVFGERRVGHAGTLDPLATGVLPLCVGPATRLEHFLVGHDKVYQAELRFGWETSTDDAEGEPTRRAPVPAHLADPACAHEVLAKLVGEQLQRPPAYAAIKVNGRAAYARARAGEDVVLDARPIVVHAAELIDAQRDEEGDVRWRVRFAVSKGTYIRSLARDAGRLAGSAAHLSGLRRLAAGAVSIDDCVTLDQLEDRGTQAAIDPVAALGLRFAHADHCRAAVRNGARLKDDDLRLQPALRGQSASVATAPKTQARDAACMAAGRAGAGEPRPGELACVLLEDRLAAVYEFDAQRGLWASRCGFSVGVSRG